MIKKNIFKYFVGLIVVLLFRFVPKPPNVEPIMSTMMPYSKKFGIWAGVLFTFLALIIFDLATGTLGLWSLFTVGAYCLVAVSAGIFFGEKKKKNYAKSKKTKGFFQKDIFKYVSFAIVGTIVYDVITGFGVGMLVFNQTFMQTLFYQIPFTLMHLASNVILSALVSPALFKWIVSNESLNTDKVIDYFKKTVRA